MVIWVPPMFSKNSLEGLRNIMFKSLKMRDEPRRVILRKGWWPRFCSVYELACVCSLAIIKHTGVHALLRADHRDFSTPRKVIPCKLGADSPRNTSPMKRTESGYLFPRWTSSSPDHSHLLLSFSALHRILLKSS